MAASANPRLSRLDFVLSWAGVGLAVVAWLVIVLSGKELPSTVFAEPVFALAFWMIFASGVLLLIPAFRRFGLKGMQLIGLGIVLNLGIMLVFHFSHIPVYFSVLGSAFAGFAAGPSMGMTVGVLSTLLGSVFYPEQMPTILLAMIPGAVVWYLFAEQLITTVGSLFVAGSLLALASSVIMVVNRLTAIEEIEHIGAKNLNYFFEMVLEDPVQALVAQTLVTQFLDKLLLLFIGYALLQFLLPIWKIHTLCLTEPAITISEHAVRSRD
ncbi:hypothetical protein QP027_04120 [Corynebacterium breve]|uniref:Uncharacterized protein n=1 Tax=Corynebacterium breve TaxID=3049799 RepID=A0ABY8VHZ4_9CORY|nr:hypothetical protein [Corynebacterium breve]WIM68586.1 hypothetical protein QP027_04120 [Corynebacterium breve]